MDYTHILSMLRSRHRIGQTPPPPENAGKAPDEQTNDELQVFIKTIPDAANVVKKYTEALSNLATEQNSISQGLGKTVGLYQTINTKIEDLVKN